MTATRNDHRARLVINVLPEHMDALERAAKDSYHTKTAKIRQIVLEYLKEHGYLENGASNGRSQDS